ncbi:MAG: PRC-barrel domain-containing protein [Dissulfurispiraceae bacterium]|jgi:sporulation protein YlmC with PRC-barrel domain
MTKVLAVMLAMMLVAFTFGCNKSEPPKSSEAPKSVESSAPAAGGTVVGVTVSEIVNVANGWSAKKQIMGHDVFNDMNEKVGQVYDIIIAPDRAVSYAIIAAGGFLGIDKHDVAIPANQFKMQDGKIVLPGATKDAIKAMPEFKYAQ